MICHDTPSKTLQHVKIPLRLGNHHLAAESLGEIFHDDTIGSGKEGEDHGVELAFVATQVVVTLFEVVSLSPSSYLAGSCSNPEQ